ncbi:MerR family transcriptional regulator [Paenibacillus contaminans]|uniref:Transcriptional regulator n=1 Tax=Paenibacillus contaminans TaxID=450362 RepID=A0A329M007_9BACL|nr:MerR family transcriptional regulator [Paenibacillus contaminans]RAV12616.1 transcriptional regulator [Paenibacillus contaminans]
MTVKIKEIAQKLNITPRAIRLYEAKGLIRPVKDKQNQYRMFSEKDAWRLQTIAALREIGVPLDNIRGMLERIDSGDKDEVGHYLDMQRSLLFAQWVELKQMIGTIDSMMERIRQQDSLDVSDMYALADGAKRLRGARTGWSDRWGFDRLAETYDAELDGSFGGMTGVSPEDRAQGIGGYEGCYEAALNRIGELVEPQQGETGLDIGTGTGNLAAKLAAAGAAMVGVDQSREMLKRCAAKVPGIETKIGNFLALPCFDQQFDFVVSSFAYHHLTDEQKPLALEEMNRVLKPGGRLCIADWMADDEAQRSELLAILRTNGCAPGVQLAAEEFYALRPEMLAWLKRNCYTVAEDAAIYASRLRVILAVKA